MPQVALKDDAFYTYGYLIDVFQLDRQKIFVDVYHHNAAQPYTINEAWYNVQIYLKDLLYNLIRLGPNNTNTRKMIARGYLQSCMECEKVSAPNPSGICNQCWDERTNQQHLPKTKGPTIFDDDKLICKWCGLHKIIPVIGGPTPEFCHDCELLDDAKDDYEGEVEIEECEDAVIVQTEDIPMVDTTQESAPEFSMETYRVLMGGMAQVLSGRDQAIVKEITDLKKRIADLEDLNLDLITKKFDTLEAKISREYASIISRVARWCSAFSTI